MRKRIFYGTLLILMLNACALFAQPGAPCAGTDPDAICPLDSWVIVLAVTALLFAVIHLRRKQVALNSSAEN